MPFLKIRRNIQIPGNVWLDTGDKSGKWVIMTNLYLAFHFAKWAKLLLEMALNNTRILYENGSFLKSVKPVSQQDIKLYKHVPVKPHKCSYCKKAFTRKNEMAS